jgi:hypothetical protein
VQPRAPRVPFKGETTVYLGSDKVVCQGGNISVEGMHILAPVPATQGQYMRVVFNLTGEWFQVDATLAWQLPKGKFFGWGVQFHGLPEKQAAIIDRYVKQVLAQHPEAAPARSMESPSAEASRREAQTKPSTAPDGVEEVERAKRIKKPTTGPSSSLPWAGSASKKPVKPPRPRRRSTQPLLKKITSSFKIGGKDKKEAEAPTAEDKRAQWAQKAQRAMKARQEKKQTARIEAGGIEEMLDQDASLQEIEGLLDDTASLQEIYHKALQDVSTSKTKQKK